MVPYRISVIAFRQFGCFLLFTKIIKLNNFHCNNINKTGTIDGLLMNTGILSREPGPERPTRQLKDTKPPLNSRVGMEDAASDALPPAPVVEDAGNHIGSA